MKYTTGNLWTVPARVRCITTNGQYRVVGNKPHAIMGKGTALQGAQLYPDAVKRLGRDLQTFGNHVFLYFVGDLPQLACEYLVTLPTKDHWKLPADPMLIARSMEELVVAANGLQLSSIVLPEPGTGAGDLSWESVEPILKYYLDDRFTVVHYG